jgi:hypothetical protein
MDPRGRVGGDIQANGGSTTSGDKRSQEVTINNENDNNNNLNGLINTRFKYTLLVRWDM